MGHVSQLKRICRFIKGRDRLITDLGLTPFQLLIATVLSSRTKEEKTQEAVERLGITTPKKLVEMDEEEIAGKIRGVAFHNQKAKRLREIARIVAEKGMPDTMEKLLELPGVGRKTASLVLAEGLGKPAICVDTHVHRISNRLGWVSTKTPHETEKALMSLFPKRHWADINRCLVSFGRKVCRPVSPKCHECPLREECPSARF